MKSLIIYCSEYKKNTEKIARIFAEKTHSELMNIKEVGDMDIEDYNIIGFGSGVYKERLSPKLYELVEKMYLKEKKVFVISTSGIGMRFYNNRFIKLLESKGAIIEGSFACKGSFIAREFTNKSIFNFLGKLSKGHPNDKDLKEAEKFIDKVVNLQ